MAEFHFIRPLWPLLAVPALLLGYGLWRNQDQTAAWRQVIDHAGSYRELSLSEDTLPDNVRHYGSPTVLVAGSDVAGGDAPPAGGAHCRAYDGGGELEFAPSVETIEQALRAAMAAS